MSEDAPSGSTPVEPSAPDSSLAKPKKPIWKRWWFIAGALLLVIIIASNSGSSSESSKQESAAKVPTMFYGLDVDQTGNVIETKFSVKTNSATGFDSIAAPGTLKLEFKWSGAGVPAKTTAKLTKVIKSSDYDCTVYCEATITEQVKNAYTDASWLDVVATFTPTGQSKGFIKADRSLFIG